MFEKYLVQIEFRYSDAPTSPHASAYMQKTITIGVYSTFADACENGNKILETLETRFDLHQFPDGNTALKQRFRESGGCFGNKKTLITNMAYLKTPFSFFAKITTLDHTSVDIMLDEVLDSVNRYKTHQLSESDE